jgi:orotate phosphoribosyltransferase
MDGRAAADIFMELGIVRKGHFLRTSGRHTNYFVQCARLFENAQSASRVCTELAGRFRDKHPDLVLSAAIGGVILCYEVSRALGIRNIYAERKDGAMSLKRGFMFAPGTKVLIVEDEITTGSSVREMIEIVRALEGVVVGIGCLVDKSGGTKTFGYLLEALMTVPAEFYTEFRCPLCAAGVPPDKV